MMQTAHTTGRVERKQKWDAFLDAYSVYLRDPTPPNAASLHLAGEALESADPSFVLREFEVRLGWDLESHAPR